MGRRYYCDYCDKTFIDDIEARKKHLQGSYHLKLRNLHYQSCRDPETVYNEESLKTPCRRFVQFGECTFEGNCKYTHYSPEELYQLRQLAEQIKAEKQKKAQEVPEIPSVESWLEKYTASNDKDSDVVHTFWTYKDSFEFRPDLPPSLKRFKPDDFHDDDFEEWGK